MCASATAGEPGVEPVITNYQAAAGAEPAHSLTVTGMVNVEGDRMRKVYVEFLASPTLTAALRTALGGHGYHLVNTREQADLTYLFDGAFQAYRPATRRTGEIRAGDYAEKPGSLVTRSGRGVTIALSLNPLTVVAGTVINAIGNATGVQDAVNSTVGDPDGKCLTSCEQWAYKQRAVVKLTRYLGNEPVSSVACQVDTTADKLFPGKLIFESLMTISRQAAFTLPPDFPLQTEQ